MEGIGLMVSQAAGRAGPVRVADLLAIDVDFFEPAGLASDLDSAPGVAARLTFAKVRLWCRAQGISQDLQPIQFGGGGQDLADQTKLFGEWIAEVEGADFRRGWAQSPVRPGGTLWLPHPPAVMPDSRAAAESPGSSGCSPRRPPRPGRPQPRGSRIVEADLQPRKDTSGASAPAAGARMPGPQSAAARQTTRSHSPTQPGRAGSAELPTADGSSASPTSDSA